MAKHWRNEEMIVIEFMKKQKKVRKYKRYYPIRQQELADLLLEQGLERTNFAKKAKVSFNTLRSILDDGNFCTEPTARKIAIALEKQIGQRTRDEWMAYLFEKHDHIIETE